MYCGVRQDHHPALFVNSILKLMFAKKKLSPARTSTFLNSTTKVPCLQKTVKPYSDYSGSGVTLLLALPLQTGGITSCGHLQPNVDVKLIDVPEMGYFTSSDPPQGEICVRTPNIIAGYYKNPEVSAEKFVDGYFRTGWYGALYLLDYTPSNKENSSPNVTPQVTRKIVHAMNVMNEFTGQGKRLITEITTPDFF